MQNCDKKNRKHTLWLKTWANVCAVGDRKASKTSFLTQNVCANWFFASCWNLWRNSFNTDNNTPAIFKTSHTRQLRLKEISNNYYCISDTYKRTRAVSYSLLLIMVFVRGRPASCMSATIWTVIRISCRTWTTEYYNNSDNWSKASWPQNKETGHVLRIPNRCYISRFPAGFWQSAT